MLGRRMFREKGDNSGGCKQQASSLSTQESYSPENTPKSHLLNKEKSELCRKYMEYGYCPYQRNCKFAHGSHQLKKNNNLNSKYKTKECGAFCEDTYCRFGDRCNFIHRTWEQGKQKTTPVVLDLAIMGEFREIFYCAKAGSRVTKLFQ